MAEAAYKVTRTLTGAILRFRKSIDDPTAILKKAGAVILAAAQKSFRDQKLGDVPWLPRYPNQGGPYINIAGAVSDLAQGPNIKQRRFQNRPVLTDTGQLRASLSPRSSGAMAMRGKYTVEVGSTLPYASTHQSGGVSIQTITETIKGNLSLFLKKQRRSQKNINKAIKSGKGPNYAVELSKARREIKILKSELDSKVRTKKTKYGYTTAILTQKQLDSISKKLDRIRYDAESYAAENVKKKYISMGKAEYSSSASQRLGFLFKIDELETKINKRPFLGITDQVERDIVGSIEQDFRRKWRAPGGRE